jgi:hypothetical protein
MPCFDLCTVAGFWCTTSGPERLTRRIPPLPPRQSRHHQADGRLSRQVVTPEGLQAWPAARATTAGEGRKQQAPAQPTPAAWHRWGLPPLLHHACGTATADPHTPAPPTPPKEARFSPARLAFGVPAAASYTPGRPRARRIHHPSRCHRHSIGENCSFRIRRPAAHVPPNRALAIVAAPCPTASSARAASAPSRAPGSPSNQKEGTQIHDALSRVGREGAVWLSVTPRPSTVPTKRAPAENR